MTTMIYLNKYLTRAYREDEGDPVRTVTVAINPAAIRCLTPRNDDQPGTRITFTDGGGFAVKETYFDVCQYIETGTIPPDREATLRLVDTTQPN